MSRRITLQHPVPYSQSYVRMLADESWHRGVGNFFLEQVPFAYTTSTEFADHVAKLLHAFQRGQTSESPLHCYEYGAGLGLFSKRIIESIATLYPHVPAPFVYHITESSSTLVEHLRTSDVFEKVEASFNTIDMTMPVFPSGQAPSVVLMNYVLDAIEATQIRVRNGDIFEMQVQTSMKEDGVLADTSVFPPRLLHHRDIAQLLTEPFSERRLLLLSKLRDLVTYDWIDVPLSRSSLSEPSQAFLKDYVSRLPKNKSCIFNYSEKVLSGLQLLFEQCAQDAMILIYDIGDLSVCPNYSDKHLISDYGICQFLTVYFPLIFDLAKDHHFEIKVVQGLDGESQFVALVRGAACQAVFETLDTQRHTLLSPQSASISDSLQELSMQDPAFLSKISSALSTLTPTQRQSHTLLFRLAMECFKRGLHTEAIAYCEQIFAQYGKMAISTYHLMGDIYQSKGDYDRAEQYLLEGISLCPYYNGFYHVLAMIYGKTGQQAKFIEFAALYFHYSDAHVIWDHLITMLLIHIQLGQIDQATTLSDWILETAHRHKSLFPDYLPEKAKRIQSYLK